MDNNIDNKGYWENQTIAQNTNEVNNNELIELLKQEFDNINKTLEVIRDGVNDIKDYAKTKDINKLSDPIIEEPKQNDIKEENKIVDFPSNNQETIEEKNDSSKNEDNKIETEENILPIGDILEMPSEENNKAEDENVVPIDLPVIDNNEELDVTEQASLITPDILIANDNVNVETPVQSEAPVLNETPVSPVMEAPVSTTVTPAPTQAETPVLNEVQVSPIMEAPVATPAPATPVQVEAPVLNETPVSPMMEAPVAASVTETPVQAEASTQMNETIDTVEIIPLTFDSAKIAPIDPNLKSAQRTEVLTENQNNILKGKSLNNSNVMSLQPAAPELVKAA